IFRRNPLEALHDTEYADRTEACRTEPAETLVRNQCLSLRSTDRRPHRRAASLAARRVRFDRSLRNLAGGAGTGPDGKRGRAEAEDARATGRTAGCRRVPPGLACAHAPVDVDRPALV